MIAGYTLLRALKDNPEIYTDLESKGRYLQKGLVNVLEDLQLSFRINRIGSMISLHFCDHDVIDFASAAKANISLFNKFFHAMLERGIYLPPSAYESWFLSNALTYEDLDRTINAANESLKMLVGERTL